MPRCKRVQLIPSTPVALLAGIFSKYNFIISAVIGGIVNCHSEGSLSLTNCLSLSRLQMFVVEKDRFALSATVVKCRSAMSTAVELKKNRKVKEDYLP